MTKPRETLTLPVAEVRLASDDEAGTLEGYAAIFGEPVERFNEVIRPGAFARSIAEHRARGTTPGMFWNHNADDVIGTWTALAEDARGLKVTGKLVTSTTRGREAHELLKAGAVTGLSIGFRSRADRRGPKGIREITDIDLIEISLTSIPAAMNARVTNFRSAETRASTAAFIQAVRRTATTLRSSKRYGNATRAN